jgi:tetratricopeptide (TPR) repeat protein
VLFLFASCPSSSELIVLLRAIHGAWYVQNGRKQTGGSAFRIMSRFNNLEFGDRFERSAGPSSAVKDGQFYLSEAGAALGCGRFEEALRAYSKVLEFDPHCAAAWTGQVRMLIELGEFQEARLWADKALEIFPNESELLAAKAVALARTGDDEAALAFSDAAMAAHGNTPYVWLARGDVLLARGEERAEFCFGKAFTLAPGDWLVHWLVCRVYYFYGKFARALQMGRKALELDGTRAAVWLQFGRCQLALGLPQAAANAFEQARELDPLCRPEPCERSALENAGLWNRMLGWWRQLAAK